MEKRSAVLPARCLFAARGTGTSPYSIGLPGRPRRSEAPAPGGPRRSGDFERGNVRFGRMHVAYPRLVHGDGPLNQSSRGGRGVDKPNGRLDRRRARAADPRALPVYAERPVLSAVRVFHRLPTAALVSEGIAPVDSPWKTLSGPSGTVDFLPRGGPEHRPIQSGFPGGLPKERSPSFESPAPIHGLRLGLFSRFRVVRTSTTRQLKGAMFCSGTGARDGPCFVDRDRLGQPNRGGLGWADGRHRGL